MKQVDARAGGRKSIPSGVSGLASAIAAIALLLLLDSGAQADVIERFKLSGDLNTDLGPLVPLVPFSGTINLDFTDDFTSDTLKSLKITVQGHVFNQSPSSNSPFLASAPVVDATNSSHETLSLTISTPASGTWNGFNTGEISFGYAVFDGVTGFFFGAKGTVTRDPSDRPIIIDPLMTGPPDPPSAPVPELSTWAMMLLGLGGLGLAAKGRSALAFLGARA